MRHPDEIMVMTFNTELTEVDFVSLCSACFSCRVLRHQQQDGAPDDGDGVLHIRIAHCALARHGAELLALPRHDQLLRHPPCPRLLQVRYKWVNRGWISYHFVLKGTAFREAFKIVLHFSNWHFLDQCINCQLSMLLMAVACCNLLISQDHPRVSLLACCQGETGRGYAPVQTCGKSQ